MDTNKKAINWDSIALMLCGRELNKEQLDDVAQLKAEYDEASKRKAAVAESI